MPFDISGLVKGIGESFTISGVTKTFNDQGDPTETYTAYYLSGIVQVMAGDEDEVREGLLEKEDIIVFVDEDETGATNLKCDNHLTVSVMTSGIFSIIHNSGHYEVQAKKIIDTSL